MDIEKLKKQHIENYKNAVIENIQNNTKSLVYDDIKSLLGKPPLDSMDLVKNKLLGLAKKNNVVLNTDELNNIFDKYRTNLTSCLKDIEKKRLDVLIKKIDNYKFVNEEDIVILYKKDFINLNKDIKKTVKNQLNISFESNIKDKINKLFSKDTDSELIDKIVLELTKYYNGSYQKQLIESLEIKILVKDTTLINGIKEQSEHYLFTLRNSRLLNLD